MLLTSEQLSLSAFEFNRDKQLFSPVARQVVSKVYWQPNISQKELVIETGIAQQSASRIIKDLIAKGVLLSNERHSDGGRGKPGHSLSVNPDYAYAIGFSITPENLSLALIDLLGNVKAHYSILPKSLEVDYVLDMFGQMYDNMLENHRVNLDKVLGAGVGIPGYFEAKSKKINFPSYAVAWKGVDIAEVFSNRFNMPIWVENDANASAGAESLCGVGKTYSDFTYLYIATGFGGGIVAERKVLEGAHGNAGELAEMLPPGVYSHPNLALLRAIVSRNGFHFESIGHMLQEFNMDLPGVDEWVHYCQNSLTLVMSACAAILDTKAIVVGGKIPKVLAQALIGVSTLYAQNRNEAPRALPDILASEIIGDPVAIGAATIPFRQFIT